MDRNRFLKEKGFLVGWKEIANYLGISVRTLRRHWKRWKLPILFLDKEVYKTPAIHIADLETWRKQKIFSFFKYLS